MLKFVAAAAVAAVVVTGMPAVSEAGHERGERARDCRICKAVSDARARMKARVARPAPVAVRRERRTFEWPKIKLPPRDPLFKRAPRQPRPARVVHVRRERPVFKWPKITLPPRDPLFKLLPRKPRPVVAYKPRERAPLFVRKPREHKPLFVRKHRERASYK